MLRQCVYNPGGGGYLDATAYLTHVYCDLGCAMYECIVSEFSWILIENVHMFREVNLLHCGLLKFSVFSF